MTTEELVTEYHPYAKAVAREYCRKYSLRGSLIDEIEADALLALWHAAQRFDPSRSSGFKGFLKQRIIWLIYDNARDRSAVRVKHKPMSLGTIDVPDAHRQYHVGDLDEIFRRLPSAGRFLVQRMMDGHTAKAAGAMMNLNAWGLLKLKRQIWEALAVRHRIRTRL